MQNFSKKVDPILKLATLVLIAWYVFLCLTHLVSQRPLWNDEECVFKSIQNFSMSEMFHRPLLALQVFPRLYLLLIQNFSHTFDFALWALRFLPFCAMMAAFVVWLKVAQQIFKTKLDLFIFVLCWCASIPLLYYSAELKQYSMDVLVGGLYMLFMLNFEGLRKNNSNSFMACLMLLPMLGLFSYPGFILAMLPLYNLIYLSLKDRREIKFLSVFLISLFAVTAVSYQFDMRLRDTAVLTREWGNYFIQTDSAESFLRHFWEGLMNLFTRWFVEKPKSLRKVVNVFMFFPLAYLFIGFFRNFKKDRYFLKSLETIAFVLFVELVILGILKKYPFTVPRTSLFYSPIVLTMTIMGIKEIRTLNKYLYYLLNGVFIIFLFVLSWGISRVVINGYLGAQSALW